MLNDQKIKDPHGYANVVKAGSPVDSARIAVIMIHGRGATAESILDLVRHINLDRVAYRAPQAMGNTWYPNSFLAPIAANEPHLTSALRTIQRVHTELADHGVPDDNIFVLGFSQGGCLGLEYVARNGKKVGGAIALSGGLIGSNDLENGHNDTEFSDKEFSYDGDLDRTPVFVGCSDNDPHVPQERILQTEKSFRNLNADVEIRIYPGMGHTVNHDELQVVRAILAGQPLPGKSSSTL